MELDVVPNGVEAGISESDIESKMILLQQEVTAVNEFFTTFVISMELALKSEVEQ